MLSPFAFGVIAIAVETQDTMVSLEITPLSPASLSLSSLGSPIMEPATKKAVAQTAVYFDDASRSAARRKADHRHTSPSPIAVAVGEIIRLPVVVANEQKEEAMTNLEKEWAAAAKRINGDNAFDAYLASIGQPTPRVQPKPQLAAQLVTQQPRSITQKVMSLSKAKKDKLEASELILLVHSVRLEEEDSEMEAIYDTCQEVAEKIKQFLKVEGVNKKIFLEHAMDMKDCYEILKKFVEGSDNQSQRKCKLYRRG